MAWLGLEPKPNPGCVPSSWAFLPASAAAHIFFTPIGKLDLFVVCFAFLALLLVTSLTPRRNALMKHGSWAHRLAKGRPVDQSLANFQGDYGVRMLAHAELGWGT